MSAGALVHTQTYDSLGNPLSYKNLKGIYNYNFTWINGRQLASTVTQFANSSYTYDADGYRLTRTVNGVEYKYTWADGLLMSQTWGNEIMIFLYDEVGSPIGFGYRYGSGDSYDYYYYDKNLHGDIVGIFDQSGTRIVEYIYDAWGDIQSMNGQGAYPLGFNNPFRYRGYYFDYETNLYYLQSRYYDPVNGRWLSPEPNVDSGGFDKGAGLTGYNVYAYCANSPVNFTDPTGEFIISAILIGAAIGLVAGAASSAISQQVTTGNINWGDVAISGLAGAVGGAIGGGVGGALYGMTAGTSVSLGQAIVIGGTSSVAAGIGSRSVYNAAYNSKASASDQLNYVFSAKLMAMDYTVGGITGGILHTLPRIEIGRIDGYYSKSGTPLKGHSGIRYKTTSGPAYSLEFHPAHNHNPYKHLQINRWGYGFPKAPGLPTKAGTPWRFNLFK